MSLARTTWAAIVRHRPMGAGVLGFAAFLSKEEVLALPLILTIWLMIDGISIKRSLRPAINGRTFTFRLIDGRVEPVRIIDVGN